MSNEKKMLRRKAVEEYKCLWNFIVYLSATHFKDVCSSLQTTKPDSFSLTRFDRHTAYPIG